VVLVVVGVDGSEESKEAFRWALEEAHLRQATLRAVHAWTYPAIFGPTYIPPEVIDRSVFEREAKQALDAIVAEIAGENPPAYVERVATEGPAAEVLVEAAAEADLLVVGSRGHGGFTGLLLGSVSQQCAHHAACAVVIVRKRREQAEAGA
jgi:nucleotide-binding universal stress UspA family protein